jgi:hypothetical protein
MVDGDPTRRVCGNCRRPVSTYAGRDEHRRGRIAGRPNSPVSAARRAEARRKARVLRRIDLEGDVCECGEPADPKLHAPLARIDTRSWKSRKSLDGDIRWDGAPLDNPAAAEAVRARGNRYERTARQRAAFGSIKGAA